MVVRVGGDPEFSYPGLPSRRDWFTMAAMLRGLNCDQSRQGTEQTKVSSHPPTTRLLHRGVMSFEQCF